MAGRRLALGVEREKLLRHVADGFAHARLARLPESRAQAVERRLRAAERLIFLHQIEPRERNVKLGVTGIEQQHEFAGRALYRHLPQAFELPDAVVHVHHVIARLEIGEIAEEARGLWPRARALRRRQRFKQIGVAVKRQLRFGEDNPFGKRRLDQNHGRRAPAASLFRQPRDRDVFFELSQAIRQFVFVANVRKPLEFARARGGDHHVLARRKPPAHFSHERLDVAVVARRWLRVQRLLRLALHGGFFRNDQVFETEPRRERKGIRPFARIEQIAVWRRG